MNNKDEKNSSVKETQVEYIVDNIGEEEKKAFLDELKLKLKEAEEDMENGKLYDANAVFKDLEEKYGYR